MIFSAPDNEMLRQLTRIADAVSTAHASPWIEWLRTIASFIAGVIAAILTAYLSDLLKKRSSDEDEQSKMRRIVYQELGRDFLEIHSMIRGETKLRRARYTVLKNLCSFDGETYMKQNPAIFYGLSEGQALTWIYGSFHGIDAGGKDDRRVYGLAQMKAPLGYFSDCYREYPTLRKHFKKVLSAHAYALVDDAVKSYRFLFTIEEAVDSGIMEIVDEPAEKNRDTGNT
jgi:hypothetical protein